MANRTHACFLGAAGMVLLARCSAAVASRRGSLDPGSLSQSQPGSDPIRTCMTQTLPRLTVSGNQLGQLQRSATAVPLKESTAPGSSTKRSLARRLAAAVDTRAQGVSAGWKAVVVRLPIVGFTTTYARSAAVPQSIARGGRRRQTLGMYVISWIHGYDAQNLNEAGPSEQRRCSGRKWRSSSATDASCSTSGTNPGASIGERWKAATPEDHHDPGWCEDQTLIVVGGLDYAYDLSPCSLVAAWMDSDRLSMPHPYRSRATSSMAPGGTAKFGNIAQQVPVIVGEVRRQQIRHFAFGRPQQDRGA